MPLSKVCAPLLIKIFQAVPNAPPDTLLFVTFQHIKQTKQNKQTILRYRWTVSFHRAFEGSGRFIPSHFLLDESKYFYQRCELILAL